MTGTFPVPAPAQAPSPALAPFLLPLPMPYSVLLLLFLLDRQHCQGDGMLAFGAGLSNPDDPDVSLTDFTGRKRLWIEVGQPEEKALQRAASQSDEVWVYAFSYAAEVWWKGIENKLHRQKKLHVMRIPHEASQAMADMAERSMQLQATIQEGEMTLSSQRGSVHCEPLRWL